MAEERIVKLAGNLINYSVELQPGEKILIEVFDMILTVYNKEQKRKQKAKEKDGK